MKSLEQMQLAWSTLAENRIVAAQDEGLFDDLRGFGRPLEEIMDISDPFGWARRAVRDCVEMQRPPVSLKRNSKSDTAVRASDLRAPVVQDHHHAPRELANDR